MSIKGFELKQTIASRLIWTAGAVGSAGLLGVFVALTGFPAQVWMTGIGLILGIGVVFFRFRAAFIGFVFLLFTLFDILGYRPLLTSPFKIYLADGIIVLMIILLLRVLSGTGSVQWLASPVTGLLLMNFFYGFFALMIGFGAGHQFNEVMGDFRRFFFYPLATLVALSYPLRRTNFRKLILLFGTALLVISITALRRVVTGQTWDPDQFTPFGDFRAISYFTGVIVLMGIGLIYGYGLTQGRYFSWPYLIMTGLMGVVFVSGYRLLWGLAATMPLIVSYSAFKGHSRVLRTVFTLGLMLILLVGTILIVRIVFPDLYALLVEKFQIQVLGFRFKDSIRYYAWKSAWKEFMQSPLIGVGMGDQFSFEAVSSQGILYRSRMTTHSIALSVLYQTGIVGGGLFLAIHIQVFRSVWKSLSGLKRDVRGPLAGMLGGYLAALTMGMFQPLFVSPGAAVALYLWIGLMLGALKVYARQG